MKNDYAILSLTVYENGAQTDETEVQRPRVPASDIIFVDFCLDSELAE